MKVLYAFAYAYAYCMLFDALRRLSGTHFLRLTSEATRCLFSNQAKNNLIS